MNAWKSHPRIVLAYHGVASCNSGTDRNRLFVEPKLFASQMAWLSRKRVVVPLDQLLNFKDQSGRHAVAITFDDGYECVLRNAVPILERHGFSATMFVPSAYVGGCNTWDEPSGLPVHIMNVDELLEAEARGLAIESHGHQHVRLDLLDEEEAELNIRTSTSVLGSLLGRKVRYLAYPYGQSSQAVEQAAARCGIQAAFCLHSGGNASNMFGLHRVTIGPHDQNWLIALKTHPVYYWARWSDVGVYATRPFRAARRWHIARRSAAP